MGTAFAVEGRSIGTEQPRIGRDVTLIFLHIGKAGGTTFHDILDRQYAGSVQYVSHGAADVEVFKKLPVEERLRIGLFRGHTNYGLHELIPRPCVYITMLRDPVERVISHYYFARRDRGHPLHNDCARGMGIEDFLYKTTDNDNGQVRVIAGAGDLYGLLDGRPSIPFGACDQALLHKAKRNLDGFLVAGLTERFDETVLLMKQRLGWEGHPFWTMRNVTEGRPRRTELPDRALELIERCNRLDAELYRHAEELLVAQAREEGPSFPLAVEYFSMLNRTRAVPS